MTTSVPVLISPQKTLRLFSSFATLRTSSCAFWQTATGGEVEGGWRDIKGVRSDFLGKNLLGTIATMCFQPSQGLPDTPWYTPTPTYPLELRRQGSRQTQGSRTAPTRVPTRHTPVGPDRRLRDTDSCGGRRTRSNLQVERGVRHLRSFPKRGLTGESSLTRSTTLS